MQVFTAVPTEYSSWHQYLARSPDVPTNTQLYVCQYVPSQKLFLITGYYVPRRCRSPIRHGYSLHVKVFDSPRVWSYRYYLHGRSESSHRKPSILTPFVRKHAAPLLQYYRLHLQHRVNTLVVSTGVPCCFSFTRSRGLMHSLPQRVQEWIRRRKPCSGTTHTQLLPH